MGNATATAEHAPPVDDRFVDRLIGGDAAEAEIRGFLGKDSELVVNCYQPRSDRRSRRFLAELLSQ